MATTPPPWQNIRGISRAVMKDNAQETLSNYNGSARPGEIVADLTKDPPTLYVGNNAGQLTMITSLNIYNDAAERDAAIPSPSVGMMVFVSGLGMQVRGSTQWNTVAGTAT